VAAAAVALDLGVSPESVAQGLSKEVEESGRMRRIRTEGGVMIIDDTYNSSPASLRMALELLGSIEWSGRRVAVLGDMLELGEYSKMEHTGIGAEEVVRFCDVLVTLGSEARYVAEGAAREGLPHERCFSYHEFEAIAREAENIFRRDDLILVKGSRGLKMERVVELLGEIL